MDYGLRALGDGQVDVLDMACVFSNRLNELRLGADLPDHLAADATAWRTRPSKDDLKSFTSFVDHVEQIP